MATNYLTNESGKFVSASADSNEIDVLNLAQVDRFVVEFSKKFSQDYISLYGANENFIFDGAGSATYNIQGGKNNVIAMSDGNDTVIDASTGTIIIQNGAKGTKTFFAGSSIQIVSSDPYTKHSQDDDLIVNFYEDEKVISSYVFKNGVNSSNSPKISATEKCLSNPDTETGEEEPSVDGGGCDVNPDNPSSPEPEPTVSVDNVDTTANDVELAGRPITWDNERTGDSEITELWHVKISKNNHFVNFDSQDIFNFQTSLDEISDVDITSNSVQIQFQNGKTSKIEFDGDVSPTFDFYNGKYAYDKNSNSWIEK